MTAVNVASSIIQSEHQSLWEGGGVGKEGGVEGVVVSLTSPHGSPPE